MQYLFISRYKLEKHQKKINKIPPSKIKIIFNSFKELKEEISKLNFKRNDVIIIAGGDGTINQVIGSILNKNPKILNKIFVRIIPLGTANDLATSLSHNITERRVIRVNKNYILTGGGFGFLSSVVKNHNSSIGRNLFKSLSYYFSVIISIFKYSKLTGVVINNEKINYPFVLIAVMNQGFIGKRFHLLPLTRFSDNINICIVKHEKNIFKRLNQFYQITKKKHLDKSWFKIMEDKSFNIRFNESQQLMADGELLETSKVFQIDLISEKIRFKVS